MTLLARYAVSSLVLLGPAMYAAEAFAVPFNAGFTAIIRRPQSWESSDAWVLLSRFTGRLLLVAGACDAVIPPDVIRRIYDAAGNTKARTLFIAPGASHFLLTDLRASAPAQLDHVLGLMVEVLTAPERS